MTPYRVDRIEGQVVFAPPTEKWPEAASGLRIDLFNKKHRLVSAVLSGPSGQFEFRETAPGSYSLVVGAATLHGLSIALRVRPRPPDVVRGPALLLCLRLKTDRRKSGAALITHSALRSELLGRVGKDQEIRHDLIQQGTGHPSQAVKARMTAIDARNTARMRVIIRRYGWPGPGLVGVDGTEAAFLMVQHAAHPFQKEMLPLIRDAYRHGKLPGQSYALLLDRVLVGDGKPQVYGTQGKPVSEWKGQVPAFYTIVDERHVDQRRAKVGLSPLAQYRKTLQEMYFPERKDSLGR